MSSPQFPVVALCEFIIGGSPFMRTTPNGDLIARYVWFGPVYVWRYNRMVELAMQGSNLCWMLLAAQDADEPGAHLY